MSNYIFDLKCPRCNGTSMITLPNREPPPIVNCGECLWKDADVVELTIVRVTVIGDK